MDTSLSLKNPKWCALVADCAKESTENGTFEYWMEANGHFGNDEEVLAFIEAHRT